MQTVRAELQHVEALIPQFNSYRAFYEMDHAPDKVREFLTANIRQGRSVIFLALNDEGLVVGFTQLYSRLSSLSMRQYLYLSDLYVDSLWRGRGVARMLMNQAKDYSTACGASSIQLETAHTNKTAQSLYESLGYLHDQEFRTYILPLDSATAESVIASEVMVPLPV
ncbi:MAG: GNAT family N-acetyltransferase [Candidatus Obscuribacterales bacterium]|nr:GNAT family N-acetyltransferase [Candidatus Obscuribacterales bacterium]